MIATVKSKEGEVIAGFVGEDADTVAEQFADEHPLLGVGVELSQGTRIELQVRDLRAGDVLIPTSACVLGSRGLKGKLYPYPSSGTRTPRGKLDVLLRHPQGRLREATWGRYTKVTVVRHSEEA